MQSFHSLFPAVPQLEYEEPSSRPQSSTLGSLPTLFSSSLLMHRQLTSNLHRGCSHKISPLSPSTDCPTPRMPSISWIGIVLSRLLLRCSADAKVDGVVRPQAHNPVTSGVQQGDPLGPLYFCCGLASIVEKIEEMVPLYNKWFMVIADVETLKKVWTS